MQHTKNTFVREGIKKKIQKLEIDVGKDRDKDNERKKERGWMQERERTIRSCKGIKNTFI